MLLVTPDEKRPTLRLGGGLRAIQGSVLDMEYPTGRRFRHAAPFCLTRSSVFERAPERRSQSAGKYYSIPPNRQANERVQCDSIGRQVVPLLGVANITGGF